MQKVNKWNCHELSIKANQYEPKEDLQYLSRTVIALCEIFEFINFNRHRFDKQTQKTGLQIIKVHYEISNTYTNLWIPVHFHYFLEFLLHVSRMETTLQWVKGESFPNLTKSSKPSKCFKGSISKNIILVKVTESGAYPGNTAFEAGITWPGRKPHRHIKHMQENWLQDQTGNLGDVWW